MPVEPSVPPVEPSVPPVPPVEPSVPSVPPVPSASRGPAHRGHDPLVVVCVRPVDLRPGVHPLTGAVTLDPLATALSRADEAALEHGLRAATCWGGTVLTVCAGSAGADAVLRDALARGCEVLRIPWPYRPGTGAGAGADRAEHAELAGDERAAARVVARVITGRGRPALVMCGDRSTDRGTGAFPAFLAHELGAAQVLGIVALDMTGEGIVAQRRLDGGRREVVAVPEGAVCSVEAAGLELRRAPLAAALAAARATVPVAEVPADQLPAPAYGSPVRYGTPVPFRPRTHVVDPPRSTDPLQRVVSLAGIRTIHDPPTVHVTDDPADAADVLLGFLQRHGYLDQPETAPGPSHPPSEPSPPSPGLSGPDVGEAPPR